MRCVCLTMLVTMATMSEVARRYSLSSSASKESAFEAVRVLEDCSFCGALSFGMMFVLTELMCMWSGFAMRLPRWLDRSEKLYFC